jgi:hypothetical protein
LSPLTLITESPEQERGLESNGMGMRHHDLVVHAFLFEVAAKVPERGDRIVVAE